jgi:CheY-like chemotaxis protein
MLLPKESWYNFFRKRQSMHYIGSIPSSVKTTLQDVVDVDLWESCLMRCRHNIYDTISSYEIDNGVVKLIRYNDRLSFSFRLNDWERTIRPMLVDNAIPHQVTRTYKIDNPQFLKKRRIYLMEDDLDMLFSLNLILEKAGYDVLLSHCGNPLLEEKLQVPNLFILDKKIADVDGLDICRHLKRQTSTKYIPCLMISGTTVHQSEAMEAGVDAFLEKPFKKEQLLELVSEFIG